MEVRVPSNPRLPLEVGDCRACTRYNSNEHWVLARVLGYLHEETLLPTVRASTSQCSLASRAATNLKYSIKNMLAICERMKRENIHTLYALIVAFMVEGNNGGNRGIKDGREIWKGDQEITKIYIPRLNSAPLGANAEMLKCHLFSR